MDHRKELIRMEAWKIVVIGEAKSDQEIASAIIDRIIKKLEWTQDHDLSTIRSYKSFDEASFIKWSQIPDAYQRLGSKFGKIGFHQPLEAWPDFKTFRQALFVIEKSDIKPDIVVFVRDTDGRANRKVDRDDLEKVLEGLSPTFEVVYAYAHSERECWVLSGFIPRTDNEKKLVANVEMELGFDPCVNSHLLDACGVGKSGIMAKKDPKRIYQMLIQRDKTREKICYEETPLELLYSRGNENGLSNFISQLQKTFHPGDPDYFTPTRFKRILTSSTYGKRCN